MGVSWAKRPVLKKTGCNRSTTGLFDFWQTGQLATGLITIHRNWQLQSSCYQLRSSPVASLCTSCQLDFETLFTHALLGPFNGFSTDNMGPTIAVVRHSTALWRAHSMVSAATQ